MGKGNFLSSHLIHHQHLFIGLVDWKTDAVLAASIFHFREFTVKEAKEYLNSRGVSVRL